MKKYIFLLVALLSSVSTWAIDYVTYNGIKYQITSGTDVLVSQSGVDRVNGDIVIPKTFTITANETTLTYNVKGFSYWHNGSSSYSVSLDLSQLTDMTSIDIYNIRTYISTLKLPKSLTSVSESNFSSSQYGNRYIGAYEIADDGTNYMTSDGVLYTKDGKNLVRYPGLKTGSSYTILNTVETIDSYAFYYQNNIQRVVMPATLKTIGSYAFNGCDKLADVNFPDNLETVGQYAFRSCNIHPSDNLLVLPKTLKSVGDYGFNEAFYDKDKITVEIPKECGLTYDAGTGGSGLTFGQLSISCNILRSYMTNPANATHIQAFDGVNRIYIPKGYNDAYSKTGWSRARDYYERMVETSANDVDANIKAPVISVSSLDETKSLLKVTITTTEENGVIYYKPVDWSDDIDVAEWPIFDATQTSTIDIYPNGCILKAVVKKGDKFSTLTQKEFKMEDYSCKTPVFNYAENSTTATITNSTVGATVYYTDDESDPSTSTTKKTYTLGTEITLKGNITYKAVAVKEGSFKSAIAELTPSWFKCKTPTATYAAASPTSNNVIVTLTTEESDVTLKYRPYGSNEFLTYTGPVTVPMNSDFYYVATKLNYDDSQVLSIYTNRNDITCAKPDITVNQDTKVLTMTAGDGVNIYYTMDGVDPVVSDEYKYAGGEIAITGNCTIKAIAHKDGWFQSEQTYYNISGWFTCPNVVIEQVFENGTPLMKLSLADSTSVDVTNMNIYYLVGDYYTYEDGWRNNGRVYSDPVEVYDGATIYAVAIKDGYIMSARSSKRMDYSAYTRCSMPTIELDNEKKTITMTTSETNGKIYYTLDGTTPTTASYLYSAPFTSEVNCTVKAITARDPETVDEVTTTYANSDVYTVSLDDWFRVQSVAFQPILGDAEGEYKMALVAEEGATIYYGINNPANIVYTDTFAVAAGDWVYAVAKKDGYVDSYEESIRINDDSYKVRTPNIYLNDVTHTIVVTPVTYGSTIYYSYDNSTPDPESASTFKVEKDTIDIVRNGTYKFLAVKDHMTNSDISTYNISWFRVPTVTITPFAENNVLKVRMECNDEDGNPVPGAAIYYATSSDYDPDNLPANAPYTGPFEIADGARIWASAQKDGYSNAYWTNTDWIYKSTYTAAMPSITIAADTTVTISSTEEGATLYYTLDGSDPTTSSTKFTSKFKMTTNGTIKAIAAANGKLNSDIRSRDYSGYSVKSVVITPIVEDNKLKIKLESETPGAQIYYGINEYNSSTIEANLSYSVPFEIPNDSYVYAIGTKEGYTNSGWTSNGWYYYSNYTCNQPTITITADTTCIMSAGEGASIYYTLNGDDPTASSTLYTSGTSGFKLTSNVTIKAIAVQSGMMNSNIRERSYSNFRVAAPYITNDGTTITITSDTPGATFKYCYEPDPRDENGNLMYSRTYTGPFEALYNSYIYVQATKDGFNSSNSDFWVPNVVKCKPVEQVSYNGHSMKLKSEEGATIWYTVNGEVPNDNSSGWNNYVYQYADSIEINNTGKIRAIATAQYKNQSDISDFEVTSFAGETGATSDKAGGLEASMGWSKPSTIKEFTISGPINASDISFVKEKMTSLEKLDLSNATIDDGNLPDNAFAGMPLLSFSSPNGIKSVGKNIFSKCKDLAAVVWNTTAKIPNDAFDADVNQNLLLFVPSQEAAPDNSSARNIIVNGTAQNIYLGDGENNNFYCPQQFYAQNITYTHDFTLESGNGYGWETIALPFNCNRFVHESKGELLPFAAYNTLTETGGYKPFWLRELTDIGFNDVSQIEANKPYIICMPNNDSYATRYRLGGKVTFSATDTWVPETNPQAVQKGVNTLYANFINNSDTENVLLLNTEDTDEYKAGSIFVLNSGRAIRPFEAYVVSQARSRASVSISRGFTDDPDGNDDSTAIKTVNKQSSGKKVKVYSLSGVFVKEAAEEDALKGLAKGVYIVNGKSMVVK